MLKHSGIDYTQKKVVHLKGYGLRINFDDPITKELCCSCLDFIEKELEPDVVVIDGDWYYSTSFTHLALLLRKRMPLLKIAVFSKEKNLQKFMDSWKPTGVPNDFFIVELLANDLNWTQVGTVAFQTTKSSVAVCFGGGVVVRKEYEASFQRAVDGTDLIPVQFHWFPVERLSEDGSATESCTLADVKKNKVFLVKHPLRVSASSKSEVALWLLVFGLSFYCSHSV
jgi:hypothetical protein